MTAANGYISRWTPRSATQTPATMTPAPRRPSRILPVTGRSSGRVRTAARTPRSRRGSPSRWASLQIVHDQDPCATLQLRGSHVDQMPLAGGDEHDVRQPAENRTVAGSVARHEDVLALVDRFERVRGLPPWWRLGPTTAKLPARSSDRAWSSIRSRQCNGADVGARGSAMSVRKSAITLPWTM